MATNIIDLIQSQLDERFTGAATSATGLSPEETKTTTRAALPALLASLLSGISRPGGSKALGSVLKGQDQDLLGNLSATLTGSNSHSWINSGIGALTSLLGEGKLSGLVNALAGYSGIGQSQSRSLIGMLFPVVMGVLGREQRGSPTPDGIANLLKSQKHEIADAIPAGLASSLRSTGLLDALDEEPARRRTTTAAAAPTTPTTPTTRRPVERSGTRLWPVLAGIAALALVAWGIWELTDNDEPVRTADTAVDDAARTDGVEVAVGDIDVRQQVGGIVDRASQALGRVTDAESAEAALPTLTELSSDLDGVMPMVDRMPDSARTAFADFARNGHARIQAEVDRIDSIQGVPESFKQVARDLSGKIESLFTRGRG